MKRFFVVVGSVIGSLLLLAVLVYVVQGLTGMGRVARAKHQAVADMKAGIPAAERQADEQRSRALRKVRGTPAYSWREVRCEFGSHDAGWMVESYTQECKVRTIDLFPVKGAKTDACDFVHIPYDYESETMVSAWRGGSDAYAHDGVLGGPMPCPSGVARPDRLGSSRLIDGSKPTNLDASPAWLMVIVEAPASETDLGCSPWGVVFCDNPFDHVEMG